MSGKKRKFCMYCGADIEVVELDGRSRERCSECKSVFYVNPLPVVSAIFVNKRREILLVLRGNEPYKNMWCLPMGFAEIDEDLESAALRELREETHVKGSIIRLLDARTMDNYFYGNIAIITYEVEMIGGKIEPGDDAIETRFFPIDEIPNLPFEPNARSIEIYKSIYEHLWKIQDSFIQFVPTPGVGILGDLKESEAEVTVYESTLQIFSKNKDIIINLWIGEIHKYSSTSAITMLERELLYKSAQDILSMLVRWLIDGKEEHLDKNKLDNIVKTLKDNNVPCFASVSAMTLLRKTLWQYRMGVGLNISLNELYKSLDVNNRIILFFDKIIYHFIMKFENK